MEITPEHIKRIEKMTFASVYPHYVTKVEKKGRKKEELHKFINWLTGVDDRKIQELIDKKATFETFFKKAKLNPNANLITGVICGYRIEEIEHLLTKQVMKSIDKERYCIRFTPRKKSSIWSVVNIAKIDNLIKQGLIHKSRT